MKNILIIIYYFTFVFINLAKERIVGGQDAKLNQFPHQISLQIASDRIHTCGGTILSNSWILTAAHCVDNNRDPNYYIVTAGSNLYKNGIIRFIKEIIIHEEYSPFRCDIALLKLTEPYQFNESLNKIDVYKDEIPNNSKIVISGWGRNSTIGGIIPEHLQFNDNILKASNEDCCDAAGAFYYDGLICLKHEKNNGVCFGDSGGPAHYNGQLAGVANFLLGGGCGSLNPDGYSKVKYFIKWINKNAGDIIV